jgi:hypothetical protein
MEAAFGGILRRGCCLWTCLRCLPSQHPEHVYAPWKYPGAGLFMCTLVLNSRESPSRSHRRCWVKARGRAPAGFAQEAGDIETASWLETGALRGHIAILEAVPSCEKFLPCAESSCGRVDKFRGGSLRIRSTYLQISRPATEGSGSSRHRTDYTGSVFPLLKPCDDARREAQVQSCNRANVRSHCNTQRGSANDHHTE